MNDYFKRTVSSGRQLELRNKFLRAAGMTAAAIAQERAERERTIGTALKS